LFSAVIFSLKAESDNRLSQAPTVVAGFTQVSEKYEYVRMGNSDSSTKRSVETFYKT